MYGSKKSLNLRTHKNMTVKPLRQTIWKEIYISAKIRKIADIEQLKRHIW